MLAGEKSFSSLSRGLLDPHIRVHLKSYTAVVSRENVKDNPPAFDKMLVARSPSNILYESQSQGHKLHIASALLCCPLKAAFRRNWLYIT